MPDLLEDFEADLPDANERPFQAWDKLLEPGETVLWEGFEHLDATTQRLAAQWRGRSPLFLIAGVLILFSGVGSATPKLFALKTTLGAAIILVGLGLFIFAHRLAQRSKEIYAYAITTRHAFIHERNARDRRMRIAHSRIDKIIVHKGRHDQVYFGQKPYSDPSLFLGIFSALIAAARSLVVILDPKIENRFGGVVRPITTDQPVEDLQKINFLVGFYNISDGDEAARHFARAKEAAA